MNSYLARGLFNIYQMCTRERFFSSLKSLEKTQWDSLEELKQMQWKRLKEMLEYAFINIPYYQNSFKKSGVSPRDINNPQDFLSLPFLTKEKVRANASALRSRAYCGRIIQYSSSGSTGEPLVLHLQSSAYGSFRAAQYRGFGWYGIRFAEPGAKIWGVPIIAKERQIERMKDWLVNRIRLSAFKLSPGNMKDFLKRCRRFKISYLYGYASVLYKFSQFLKENKYDAQSLRLKAVISTSEILYDFQRTLIESTFGCKAVSEYGAAEMGIIAFECSHGKMHLSCENVYLEIIKDNRIAKLGEVGEIVVTSLKNYYMPLIRYKLGDLGRLSEERCNCGRGLPLIEAIEGRSDDIVISPDGTYLSSQVFNYINRAFMKYGKEIKEFKIIQKKTKNLLILIVKNSGFNEKAVSFLKQELGRFMGGEVVVDVQYVEKIPREKSGKIRYFVSEIV